MLRWHYKWAGPVLSLLISCIVFSPALSGASDFFPTRTTLDGFYSPVFSPDASKALYIKRQVKAWDWGPGWEHFSPPAWVRISHDEFRLMEFDLKSDTISTLRTFPKSPLVGATHRHYRGRLYGSPRVMIRYEPETGQLEYEIGLSVIAQPSSTSHRVFRWWNNKLNEIEEPANWRQEYVRMQGINEDRLRGQNELLTLPGREGMPCAIILWDHASGEQKVLISSDEYEEIYPDGIPANILIRDSKKENIEYSRRMRSDYDTFHQNHLAAGLRDNDARLAANKDMQRAGYYPKTPTLSARQVTAAEVDPKLPIFDITRTEMESGIFNDIAAAIFALGSDVDHNGHNYITYQGYDTSQRLNEYLKSGKTTYAVRYLDKTYVMTIDRPKR